MCYKFLRLSLIVIAMAGCDYDFEQAQVRGDDLRESKDVARPEVEDSDNFAAPDGGGDASSPPDSTQDLLDTKRFSCANPSWVRSTQMSEYAPHYVIGTNGETILAAWRSKDENGTPTDWRARSVSLDGKAVGPSYIVPRSQLSVLYIVGTQNGYIVGTQDTKMSGNLILGYPTSTWKYTSFGALAEGAYYRTGTSAAASTPEGDFFADMGRKHETKTGIDRMGRLDSALKQVDVIEETFSDCACNGNYGVKMAASGQQALVASTREVYLENGTQTELLLQSFGGEYGEWKNTLRTREWDGPACHSSPSPRDIFVMPNGTYGVVWSDLQTDPFLSIWFVSYVHKHGLTKGGFEFPAGTLDVKMGDDYFVAIVDPPLNSDGTKDGRYLAFLSFSGELLDVLLLGDVGLDAPIWTSPELLVTGQGLVLATSDPAQGHRLDLHFLECL